MTDTIQNLENQLALSDDKNRLELLLKLAKEYASENPQKCMQYAQQGINEIEDAEPSRLGFDVLSLYTKMLTGGAQFERAKIYLV